MWRRHVTLSRLASVAQTIVEAPRSLRGAQRQPPKRPLEVLLESQYTHIPPRRLSSGRPTRSRGSAGIPLTPELEVPGSNPVRTAVLGTGVSVTPRAGRGGCER